MPVRQKLHQATANDVMNMASDDGETRETALPATIATERNEPFEFFAALSAGGYDWLDFTPSDGSPIETWLTQPNGSWVCHVTHPDGRHFVRQGGPQRLWDHIETAYREWQRLGRPGRQRFGLTVRAGRQTVWLDHPDGPHHWELAS